MERQFTIFFSWQSDLPNEQNTGFIRQGLRTAANQVEQANPGLVVRQDEATRALPGSPNIPSAIMEKIQAADMFVCDVSTTARTDAGKASPNPNVAFELGYAVAHLGWSRIVLLFNTSFGTFPLEMPFDFDRHRATKFAASSPPSASERGEFVAALKTAIEGVIKGPHPKREAFDIAGEKRARDLHALRAVLSTLHIPTLDSHLRESPAMFRETTIHFWEEFDAIMSSSLFHLYDDELLDAFDRLHVAFATQFQYDTHYHSSADHRSYIFSHRGFATVKAADEALKTIEKANAEMEQALADVLDRVRAQYLEINLTDTNKVAWDSWINFQREADKLLRSTSKEDEIDPTK